MKIQLIKSYPKRSTITDVNGLPVVDEVTQRPKTKLITMWRYAVIGATEQEKAMYKRFRRQDGQDYYKEVRLKSGEMVPVYTSNDFMGKELPLEGYTREDGRIGFSVDTTEADIYTALAEKNPLLAATLASQLVGIMSAGTRVELANEEDDMDDEQENHHQEAFDTKQEEEESEKG